MEVDRHVGDPHWGALIVAYFFLGGIAAGAYAMAALAGLFGAEADRRATRAASYLAFPLVSICGILLIVDLNRPERFWHMLIASETLRPIFKWYSPMSVGSWGLSVFGAFSFISFLAVLAEDGFLRWNWLKSRIGSVRGTWIERVYLGTGCLSAFFLGAYTGTLLSASNQPVWAQSNWISALFLASAASTGVAATLLVNRWVFREQDDESTHRLEWLDRWAVAMEGVLLVIFVATLGRLGLEAVSTWPGLLLIVVVVPLGIIVPLATKRFGGSTGLKISPVCVLIAGLALRLSIVGMPLAFMSQPG
jgi:protein NrfD